MLAIIASEERYLCDLLEKIEHKKVASPKETILYEANYLGHNFIIMVSGYGKVNISRSLQFLKDNYPLKVISLIGTAGSTDNSNELFSSVICDNTLQFDVDFSPIGYEPSILPLMKTGVYSTNSDLKECMEYACKKSGLNYNNCLISSSDMFVCNNQLASSIKRQYGPGAVDYDCGVVGQFSYINNIPFICVKTISNFAGNNAIRQYKLYDQESGKISQKIMYQFLRLYYE